MYLRPEGDEGLHGVILGGSGNFRVSGANLRSEIRGDGRGFERKCVKIWDGEVERSSGC